MSPAQDIFWINKYIRETSDVELLKISIHTFQKSNQKQSKYNLGFAQKTSLKKFFKYEKTETDPRFKPMTHRLHTNVLTELCG